MTGCDVCVRKSVFFLVFYIRGIVQMNEWNTHGIGKIQINIKIDGISLPPSSFSTSSEKKNRNSDEETLIYESLIREIFR